MFQKVGDLDIYWIGVFYCFFLFFLGTFVRSTKNEKWSHHTGLVLFSFSLMIISNGLFIDDGFVIPVFFQIIVSSGLAVLSFVLFGFFVRNLMGIKNLQLFQPKIFVFTSIISLSGSLITYFLTDSILLGEIGFAIPIAFICLFFSIDLIIKLVQLYLACGNDSVYYKRSQIILVTFSMISLFSVVVLQFFGEPQIFEQTAITLSGISVFLIYLLEEQKNKKMETISAKLNVLTEREKEIFNLIVDGYSDKEIALIIHRSCSHVSGYCSIIREKLNVGNNEELENIL